MATRDLWRCDKCFHWNSTYDNDCVWCNKTEDSEPSLVDTNDAADKIKNKVVDLWSDLQQADLSLDEFEELREFIMNLFLEDK